MDLLTEIEGYLARASQAGTRMAETRFGVEAINDGNLIKRLRKNPQGITLRTVERVRKWMADNPPGKRSAA